MANKIFTFRHSVYFNETNAMGGVVYFANYVKWQGMVREDFFQKAVPNWDLLMQEVVAGRVNMATVEEHSQFLQHCFFGDQITIQIHATEIRKLSFKILFSMTKNGRADLIYTGWQKLAFDDFKGHFIPIPEILLQAVLDYTPTSEIEKYKAAYSKEEANINRES